MIRRKKFHDQISRLDEMEEEKLSSEHESYSVYDNEKEKENSEMVEPSNYDDVVSDERTTTIHEGMKMTGDVSGSHNLHLNCDLEGKIDLSALLVIGKTGRFKGEIKAHNIIIEGVVEGKITASEKVEIRNNGRYTGDIISPSVMIDEKAFFQGNVQMSKKEEEKPYKSFLDKNKLNADQQDRKKEQHQEEKHEEKHEAVSIVE